MVLCWHCDNQLRDQTSESWSCLLNKIWQHGWLTSSVTHKRYAGAGIIFGWIILVGGLHQVVDALPEAVSRRSLGLPAKKSARCTAKATSYRESRPPPHIETTHKKSCTVALRPPATKSPQEKTVVSITVDPESPESSWSCLNVAAGLRRNTHVGLSTAVCLLRYASRRSASSDWSRQGGMGTKAHDLFVLPLCRKITTSCIRIQWHLKISMAPNWADISFYRSRAGNWRTGVSGDEHEPWSLTKILLPKISKIEDDAPATGTGCLTITDVMAAQGWCSRKHHLGWPYFWQKLVSGPSVCDWRPAKLRDGTG